MKRLIYKELLRWKESEPRKPLILQGARQVGKTYILKEFAQNEFRRMHYLNFEKRREFHELFEDDLDPSTVVDALGVLLGLDIDPANDVLVLDEIQQCPRAMTSLKYFNEEMPEMAVMSAGSHIGLMLGEGSYPVGQTDLLKMYPLNFEEFLMARNPQAARFVAGPELKAKIPEAVHDLLWKELKLYYVVGGLPEIVMRFSNHGGGLHEALSETRMVQEKLLQGYRSDFAKHAGKVNATHITRVFENIPEQISKVMDDSVGRYRFKGVIPNYSKFSQLDGPIDWLVKAGLAIKAYVIERAEIPLRAYRKDNTFKLYLFDVGLLGCMLDLPFDTVLNQDYGSYKGYYAENFVAQEFVASGVETLYSWRGRSSEIEFLRMVDDGVVPVEVKSGTHARSRSMSAFVAKYDPGLRIKLTARNLDCSREDFHNYPLYLAGKIKALVR